MYKQNEHVTKRDDGKWQVIGEGNKRASAVTDTQAQAIVIAKDLAINSWWEWSNQRKEFLW